MLSKLVDRFSPVAVLPGLWGDFLLINRPMICCGMGSSKVVV